MCPSPRDAEKTFEKYQQANKKSNILHMYVPIQNTIANSEGIQNIQNSYPTVWVLPGAAPAPTPLCHDTEWTLQKVHF